MQAAGFEPGNIVGLLEGFRCDIEQEDRHPGHEERFHSTNYRRKMAQTIAARNDGLAADSRRCEYDRDYLEYISPALLADARASIRSGLWTQAERDLSNYLRVRSDDPMAYFLTGEVQRRLAFDKRAQDAIMAYSKAILLDQSFAPAYRELGVVHFKLGQRKTAKKFFETYLSLAPQAESSDYIRGYLSLCSN